MPVTIATLMPLLQARLNDASDGQWTQADKRQFINSARKRTVVQTKCYNTLQPLALAGGTATYSAEPVFEPLAVRMGDSLLVKVQLASMPVITENWDAAAAGQPTKWTPIYGSAVRICPVPAATDVGVIAAVASTPTNGGNQYTVGGILTLTEGTGGTVRVVSAPGGVVTAVELVSGGYGYTVGANKATVGGGGSGCTVAITVTDPSDHLSVYGPSRVTDLATDDTEIIEIPPSHCEEVLLLAAEEEARRARPTMTGSVELAGLLHALWLEKCQDIKRVLGVVG